MIHILKFIAIWFAAAILAAGALYAMSGSPSSLNPQIEAGFAKECESLAGAFTEDSAQECLTQVARRLERMSGDAQGSLLRWHSLCAALTLLLGLAFMIKIVLRARTAGTLNEFRSLRTDWYIYLAAIIAVGLVSGVLAHGRFFDSWALTLTTARGWGIPALTILVWVVAYWVGTRVATPSKMQPSIPFS